VSGGSFQDALRQRETAEFVARSYELTRFRTNLGLDLDDRDRRFIFSIHGDGGVGKTFLSRRLREIAESSGAATAWVDERVFGIPEAMQAIAADLTRQGEDMSGFTKLLGTYLKRRQEVTSDPDAPAGLASLVTQIVVKVGLDAAKGVPGVGGIVSSVDAAALAEQTDQLRVFLGKKFRRKDDIRLLLSPLEALTPAFAADLSRAGRRRTQALFFDTYEQTGLIMDDWLRALLGGSYGDLPKNLVLTIAGRHPLSRAEWTRFAPVMAYVPLVPFTEDEARQLLAEKGVTDEQVVRVIITLSGRLPLLVATLAENHPSDPNDVGDLSGDAVQRFLKWETDPARQAIAKAAALPRVINEDVLGVLAARQDTDKGRLFDWLRSLAFVHANAGRLSYHEVVRTAMIRLERSQSPVRWREIHRALAAAYREWRLAASGEDNWGDPAWLASKIEETYHLLCADPAKELAAALSELPPALRQSQSVAVQWAQLIVQAGEDAADDGVRRWGQDLESALHEEYDNAVIACMSLLIKEKKLTPQRLTEAYVMRGWYLYLMNRDEDALVDFGRALNREPDDATALYFRAECYRWLRRYDEALADLNKVLDLVPDLVDARVDRGEVYELTGRYAEALDDLNHALESAPDNAKGAAERGETYRLMGQPENALADFNRAIELDPDYDYAIACRGYTYLALGRHKEALSDFSRAIELDPEYTFPLTGRIQVYKALGRHDDVLSDLGKVIDLTPGSVAFLLDRAMVNKDLGRFDQAISDFTRVLAIDPLNAEALTWRGDAYRVTGRIPEALDDLDAALRLKPDNSTSWAARAMARQSAGQYEEALADFVKAIELGPEYAWALARRAQLLRILGRYAEALRDLDKAIAAEPADSFSRAVRGWIYWATGRSDEALPDLDKAVELDPTDAWAVGTRGQAYQALGRYPEALADLDRALELKPDDAWTLTIRGQTRFMTGSLDDALSDLDRALQLDPSSSLALSSRGEVYRLKKQAEQALRDFNDAIEIEEDNMLARIGRGIIHLDARRAQQALADLDRAVSLVPEDFATVANRGEAHRLLGQYDQAIADFSTAIDGNPDDVWSIGRRGVALSDAGRDDEAIVDLDAAVRRNPDDSFILAVRGQLHFRADQYEAAIGDLTRALEIDPDYQSALTIRADAYSWAERHTEALADLDRAVQLAPDDYLARLVRGQVLRQLRRYEEAFTDLDKAVSCNPDDALAWAERGGILARLGRDSEALDDLNQAIQRAPDNTYALVNKARVLRRTGQLAEAASVIARAVELEDNDPWNHYCLFLVESVRGDQATAERGLTAAIERSAARCRSAGVTHHERFNHAVYLAAQGDYESAGQALRDVLELQPGTHRIQIAIDDLRELAQVLTAQQPEINALIELLTDPDSGRVVP
jgi:tetratricopeptide (TPR) repeat protein